MNLIDMFYREIEDAKKRKVPLIIPIGTMEYHAEHASPAGVLTIAVPGGYAIELGTVTVEDGAGFNIACDLTLGAPERSLGGTAGIHGTVSSIGENCIVAYAYTDIDDIEIEPDSRGRSTAVWTEFYINDLLYMTLIAGGNGDVTYQRVLQTLTFDIAELDEAQLEELRDASAWGLKPTDRIGLMESVYADWDYREIGIIASSYTGLSLFIDGMRVMSPSTVALKVGVHQVTAKVDPGYVCDDMRITFKGADVTSSEITVTVDDEGSILVLSGDVHPYEPGPTPAPEQRSEWTVTTILLAALVALIAVIAVIVAARLNKR